MIPAQLSINSWCQLPSDQMLHWPCRGCTSPSGQHRHQHQLHIPSHQRLLVLCSYCCQQQQCVFCYLASRRHHCQHLGDRRCQPGKLILEQLWSILHQRNRTWPLQQQSGSAELHSASGTVADKHWEPSQRAGVQLVAILPSCHWLCGSTERWFGRFCGKCHVGHLAHTS